MRVERVVVPIGVRPDGNTGALAGHPGLLERLNVGLVPALQTDWTVVTPAFPAGSEATLHNTAVRISAPRRFSGDGPVTAIAIAPDSPIEACDLYIGGSEGVPHRVGIGAPFIGTIDEAKELTVVPVRDTPPPLRREFMLGTMSGDTMKRETKFWDMDQASNGAGAFGGYFNMPLRLDFYRGSIERIATAMPTLLQKRARYTANMIFEVLDRGGAVATSPGLLMIVDGRRKFRIVAGLWVGAGAAGSLHVYGIEGRAGYIGDKSTTAPLALPLDWPVYDEILAATPIPVVPSCLVFDWPGGATGNPYWAVQAAVEAASIGTRGFITIHAWDD